MGAELAKDKGFELGEENIVTLHGEEVEGVKTANPATAEKPYWTLVKDDGNFILATGNVAIELFPPAKISVKGG